MIVILYDRPSEYEAEYDRVRAALVARGTSLNQWLEQRGISRQLAYRALKGQSLGQRAIELRRTILKEVLSEAVQHA